MSIGSRINSFILTRLSSLPILGIVLFIFSATFPPFDLVTETDLAAHMGQHVLIVVSGVLIAYPLYKKREKMLNISPSKKMAILSIPTIAAIVVFWHLPLAWDAAVLNPLTHGIEHFCFLVVGLLIGWYFPSVPDNLKFMSVFLAASAHMVYGLLLFIMTTRVYSLYSVSQQSELGVIMLFPAPLYFLSLMAVSLHRETRRLESLEAPSTGIQPIFSKSFHNFNLRRAAVPAASLLLIVIFVGYLVVTAGMIYFPPYPSAAHDNTLPLARATVYIVETPVTWNYAPQNIVVVIGVNNTVVWFSHSLSEDTVTSDTGLFNSGVLTPGQSWSYTFSKPGVYQYYCDFHPWMQGTVTVLD